MTTIEIWCLNGVFDSALHVLRDVLATASRLATQDSEPPSFRIASCTMDGTPIRTGSGQSILPDGAFESNDPDIVVVPGMACENANDLKAKLQGDEVVAVGGKLQRLHGKGVQLASACSGVWLLAEVGLLDGKQATTTWHLGAAFRERYADVDLRLGKMVTFDQGIWCAGAAMAHMDLAMSIVTAVFGSDVSQQVASLLLLDNRPSQAHYMVAHYQSSDSTDFREIDQWIQDHLDESFSMSDLAAGIGWSERTLVRRIRSITGETPLRYVQRLRVNRAILLLETSALTFTQITKRVGYREPASLRRIIRKQTGRAPSDYRTGKAEPNG